SPPCTATARPPASPGCREGSEDHAAAHRPLRVALPAAQPGVLGRLCAVLPVHVRLGDRRPDPDRQPRQRQRQLAVRDAADPGGHEPVLDLRDRGDRRQRDDETGFAPIIRSTSVSKFSYLVGRFTGATAAAFGVLAMIPLAIAIGAKMPWLDP